MSDKQKLFTRGLSGITTGAMIEMPPPIAAYVHWIDSKAYPWDEYEAEDIEDYNYMDTIGWIVQEDDDKITLALDKTSNDKFRFMLTIPKIAIKFRQNLDIKLQI